jgi:sirohydrochlorin cobaltochelatase
MRDLIEELFNGFDVRFYFGQILIQKTDGSSFVLVHREEAFLDKLQTYRNAEDAIEIAKYDDKGNYRPLKTAPDLRHGWRLELAGIQALRRALNYFYPGRLAIFEAWKTGDIQTTPLRETLSRQSGMYRVAAKISDEQANNVVADFCQSNSGCLRTILWDRDGKGLMASTKLPKEKFDPGVDQANISVLSKSATAGTAAGAIPLLCQEACNLLVNECRRVVKGDSS